MGRNILAKWVTYCDRVTIHNQQICEPSKGMLKVGEHISNCANAMTPKYDIFSFYKMYSESTTLRRANQYN